MRLLLAFLVATEVIAKSLHLGQVKPAPDHFPGFVDVSRIVQRLSLAAKKRKERKKKKFGLSHEKCEVSASKWDVVIVVDGFDSMGFIKGISGRLLMRSGFVVQTFGDEQLGDFFLAARARRSAMRWSCSGVRAGLAGGGGRGC
ncbi:MAG TPA: hypothetical protein PK490_09435 [Prosthecobacter sp.]|nr:hypothetical protein [Prosthecobacter sp.]